MKVCVAVGEATTAAVVDRMAELAGAADLFEMRGDWCWTWTCSPAAGQDEADPLHLPSPLGGRALPGRRDPRRRRRCCEAVKRGFDYVDVEHAQRLPRRDAWPRAGSGLIVSRHDLEGTPEDLDGLYAAHGREAAPTS